MQGAVVIGDVGQKIFVGRLRAIFDEFPTPGYCRIPSLTYVVPLEGPPYKVRILPM